jgi:hypothetical protein
MVGKRGGEARLDGGGCRYCSSKLTTCKEPPTTPSRSFSADRCGAYSLRMRVCLYDVIRWLLKYHRLTHWQSKAPPEVTEPTDSGANKSTRPETRIKMGQKVRGYHFMPASDCFTSVWMDVELRPRELAAEAAAAEPVIRTQAGAPAQWWVSQRTRRSTAASLSGGSWVRRRQGGRGGGKGGEGGGACGGWRGRRREEGRSRDGARWQTHKIPRQRPVCAVKQQALPEAKACEALACSSVCRRL